MACPEGKLLFNNVKQASGYWEKKENILKFLSKIKQKYNLDTPEDWNSINASYIQSNGGSRLLAKYSLHELKCMACQEGKSIFDKPKQTKPAGYWEDETNRNYFFSKIKEEFQLQTPADWKRISQSQIISRGGSWLFSGNNDNVHIPIQYNLENGTSEMALPWKELVSTTQTKDVSKGNKRSSFITNALSKRSSQRWLFLQVQKLFPHEEIVEDYFHSDLSRASGANVQFDIFMVQRNIAIEYHGKQHYEDNPQGFCSLEVYKYRDKEKKTLCKQYGIQLIVVPYWWDNKLDSLRATLSAEICF